MQYIYDAPNESDAVFTLGAFPSKSVSGIVTTTLFFTILVVLLVTFVILTACFMLLDSRDLCLQLLEFIFDAFYCVDTALLIARYGRWTV